MSRKAGLHAENYTVKEQVERDTTDAETGLNNQQKTSDGLKIEGLALPFGKRSRNGVIYEKQSVKEAAESLIGCPLLFNHDENNPIGHIEDVEITDEGLKYFGDLNEERKEVESLKRGDIPHVSIQAMVEETGNTETNGEVGITEFLEMSAVTVPGFSQTDVETSDETVMIEKLMTEEEAEEKLGQENNHPHGEDTPQYETSEEKVEDRFEFVPIPSLVLYDNEGDARERANDLGIEGIHTHEFDNQTFYMAGKTHGEWRQLVGKQEAENVQEEEDTSKEPFAGYDDFDECVADNQDKSDPEAYCAAIKRRAENKSILGEKTYMTEQEDITQEEDNESAESEQNQTEQLGEDDLEEVMGVVGGALQGAEEDIVDGAQAELDLSDEEAETLGGIVEQVMQDAVDQMEDDLVGEESSDMPDEDDEEDEAGDMDDEEDDDMEESQSSNKKGESQDSNDMSSKTKEELESRIEELEETIMELEDTEPSKQEAANGSSSNDSEGFQVRKDIKERLDR